MAMIIDSEPGRRPGRGRWLALGAAVVIVVVVVAFVAGRGGTTRTADPVPPVGPGELGLTWSTAGTQPVPGSILHGPRTSVDGLASGFAHDGLGAVLAAINISARLSGDVGPLVYQTTVRQQCIGDLDATIANIDAQTSTATPGSARAQRYWFRITSGDPVGDLVVVSLRASSAQSHAMGGFVELDRTLQWVSSAGGGDWKVQVPPTPPQLVTSVENYTDLGGPDA